AHVKGTDSTHKVIIQDNQSKCTCQWWTSYQGNRGICKHILAVKLSKNNFEK
ncbi:MAG: SWIM zinc finger family protein, partial [Chitinophagales bacterium]|nr:SWIM zinc finger family protein [Chitinophagales bacterium]